MNGLNVNLRVKPMDVTSINIIEDSYIILGRDGLKHHLIFTVKSRNIRIVSL